MQELFDNLEAIDITIPIGVKEIFFEKEKQQIKAAYKFGLQDEYVIGSEQYYQQYKLLLETYICGFNDELDGRTKIWNPNPLLLRAYNLGRQDAIIGDDVRSVDYITNEEIFNKILNQNIC